MKFLSPTLPADVHRMRLDHLERCLTKALRLGKNNEVSVVWVTRPRIRALNKRFRGRDRETDVLSFAPSETSEAGFISVQSSDELGDLIVCPAYARAEARRRSIPFEEECIRLLTHGVLHLRGYDHATEVDELRMFKLQERIVEQVMSS